MSSAIKIQFDQPAWKVVFDVERTVLEYGQASPSSVPVPYSPEVALAMVVDSGPRGTTGPRGPAGVVVIDKLATAPPEGTPVGTVIYQLIN